MGDHTEVFQVDYDPNQISYEELLEIFWKNHSPESLRSRQYMSIIFYVGEKEKKLALETKAREEKNKEKRILTEIVPAANFYLAENYHQKYYLQSQKDLMMEFKNIYPEFDDFNNSTVAARVNGYVKGHGTLAMLEEEIDNFRLSEKGKSRLIDIVEGHGGRKY